MNVCVGVRRGDATSPSPNQYSSLLVREPMRRWRRKVSHGLLQDASISSNGNSSVFQCSCIQDTGSPSCWERRVKSPPVRYMDSCREVEVQNFKNTRDLFAGITSSDEKVNKGGLLIPSVRLPETHPSLCLAIISHVSLELPDFCNTTL